MGRSSSAKRALDYRTIEVTSQNIHSLVSGVSSHPIPDAITIHLPGVGIPMLFDKQDEITLGRGDGVTLSLPDFDPAVGLDIPLVSRRHAIIRRTEWGFTIEDLSSTNGTWINGMQLLPGQTCLLRNGDQVKLAEQLLLVYFPTRDNHDQVV